MAYDETRPPLPRRITVNVAAIDGFREAAARAEAEGRAGDALLMHGLARMACRPGYAGPRRPVNGPGRLS